MTLEETFPHVLGFIAADPAASVVPRVSQLDPDYESKFEAALRDSGAVFILWQANGVPAAGNATPALDLQNEMILSVVERPRNNKTGKSALQWVHRLLLILHQAGVRRGRPTVRHPDRGPAYELGPIGGGLVVYFVNLVVRSTEDLPLPPPAVPSP